MKYYFKPTSDLERFGEKVYSLLVENFSQTFFVGGMVRDLLLKRKVGDIDIATSAQPNDVIKILDKHLIKHFDAYKKFGVIVATHGRHSIEIATFRKERYGNGRYPAVQFIVDKKIDSMRRDFTVNALYLQHQTNIITDYYKGSGDIKRNIIKFVGNPKKRIKEDPLRIIRALRFAITLRFNLSTATRKAIKNNFSELKNITNSRIENEIEKVRNKSRKNILKKVINNQKLLDKYF